MSFPHEVIDALPTAAPADKELLRALLTRRFAYALAASESASDFVAKDPVSSIPPLYLVQNGTLYAYDETDTTTSASAVCLVTNDACRYKSGVVEPPYSVLTYSTTAQPADVDVSDGDTFLLPIGATGADWAGKAGQIAMRVGAKWHFAISPIGRRLYVEDEDRFYYRNDSGVWVTGNGTLAFAANSIPITAIIGAKASFVVKVENQTTNAPPASPVAPVAYIIGPSPTGAWAGLAGQLAICLVNGAYTIINPDEGDEVWDKTRNAKYIFDGSAWKSSVGAWIDYKREKADGSAAGTFRGTTSYGQFVYNALPASTVRQRTDPMTIAFAAKAAGNLLRIKYNAIINFTVSGGPYLLGLSLFRDAETTAIAQQPISVATTDVPVNVQFLLTAADTTSHTYYVSQIWLDGTTGSNVFLLRTFEFEEHAI